MVLPGFGAVGVAYRSSEIDWRGGKGSRAGEMDFQEPSLRDSPLKTVWE